MNKTAKRRTTSAYTVRFTIPDEKDFLNFVARDGRPVNALLKVAMQEYMSNHPQENENDQSND